MRLEFFTSLLGWLIFVSFSAGGTEFNNYFIKSDNQVDLSKFEKSNYIPDGSYKFDIYFNQEYLQTENLHVLGGVICINEKVLGTLPLSDNSYIKYSKTLNEDQGNKCFQITDVPFSQLNADMGKGRIDISVPQEYLAEEYKSGFVNPKLWDDGISGLFLDYHANYFATKQNDNSDWYDDLITYGTIGANAGPVRLRAQYQKSTHTDGEFTSYYGYVPVRSLKSKLTFGNTQFGSDIYDAFRMTGVRLQSDDQMLPSYLRGYSPVISGTVDSNAVITISQQGRVLKVVNVNSGPYVIDDLSQASQGDIDVEVRQANGKTQTYQVNGASVQYLTRPGHLRYSLSAGVPESDIYEHTPGFVSAEGAYGLNNMWSVFSGTLLSQEYQVYTLGSGINLNQFGALSFDLSLAQADIRNSGKESGTSYGFSYNNTLTEWGVGLRVAGYRFSQERFYEFDEYLHSYDDHTSASVYTANNNKKDEKYITLTQRIGDASLFLSYSSRDYWDSRRSSNRYDITLSKPFTINGLTFYFNTNLYKSENSYVNYSYENGLQTYQPDQDENGWSVGVSIPLGNSHTVSIQSKTNDHQYSQTIAYAGRDTARNANYRISFDEHEGKSVGVSGNYSRSFAYVSTSVGGSYQTDDYQQLNASASGTVLLTQHGLAYSNLNAGDTRLLIDSKVADVAIQGTGNQSSNAFGLALVNGITPYQKSWNTIDYKSLPNNVEVLDSIKSVVLTEGAIGFQAVRARQGENFLARLTSEAAIPFGAYVLDEESSEEVGIVGSDQTVYLSGVNATTSLTVVWGEQQSCRITISEKQLHSEQKVRQLECH